eukprot:CAMPEP_0196575746 /NCGR_PEP_ID=MMETSP1081-20130531/5164_1 /TAXON_ID=36882 /ORGANISM="Pyramimonas amylifera, Strain CCMP720" /LENGTH=844 /DNA_ID=CAMNT_0041894145 /DNA_START=15 /DNA_END=2549 /DNA_ORIENTATION=+
MKSMTSELGSPLPAMAAGAKAFGSVSQRVISDAHFLEDAQYEDESAEITRLLRGPHFSAKADGLKRLIACISVGRDVSKFFPNVVVNVEHVPFEVKNLVYIFLVRYAESKPDEALLSINTFQKDLSDKNPRIRALALRVMSSIRVPATVPIVMLAIRKCALDSSVYVRKAAAHAVPKVFTMDPSMTDQLMEVIEMLLADRTPLVVGSAVAAFLAVCPERLDLLHSHFRKLCKMIVDVDEWGQALLTNLLLRYARTQFCKPDSHARTKLLDEDHVATPLTMQQADKEPKLGSNILARNEGFYSDSSSDDEEEDGSSNKQNDNEDESVVVQDDIQKTSKKFNNKKTKGKKSNEDDQTLLVDKDDSDDGKKVEMGSERCEAPRPIADDHNLLLRSTRPLLQSHNSSVVVGTAALHFYLAPLADLPRVASALLFTFRTSPPEGQQVLMSTMASMVGVQPQLFAPHVFHFYVRSHDPYDVRLLKLQVLTSLITQANSRSILQELQAYLRDLDRRFVLATIRALGRCAGRLPSAAGACVRALVALTGCEAGVAAEAVVVIRALVQHQPKEHSAVVLRLMRSLPSIKASSARAAVVWMAGGDFGQGPEVGLSILNPEHAKCLTELAPHVLRQVAAQYALEDSATKLQLASSLTKLKMRSPNDTHLMALHRYVLTLARYDKDYDVRDRARFLRMLVPPEGDDVAASALTVHAQAILLCASPPPPLPSLAVIKGNFTLATLSHAVQHSTPGYFALAHHPINPTNPNIREPKLSSSRIPKSCLKKQVDFSDGSGEDSESEESRTSGSSGEKSGDFYSESGSSSGNESESESESGSGESGSDNESSPEGRKPDEN